MSTDRWLGIGLAFTLGACASAAVRSDPVPAAQAAPAATVIAASEAPAATAPNGKAVVRHLARGENAYLGRLEMQAGAAVPEHRDPTEEYIYVLEGRGTMTIDGQVYAVEPGTAIYMPANAQVSFQNGDAPLVGLQVFAGPGPAAKYEAWTKVGGS